MFEEGGTAEGSLTGRRGWHWRMTIATRFWLLEKRWYSEPVFERFRKAALLYFRLIKESATVKHFLTWSRRLALLADFYMEGMNGIVTWIIIAHWIFSLKEFPFIMADAKLGRFWLVKEERVTVLLVSSQGQFHCWALLYLRDLLALLISPDWRKALLEASNRYGKHCLVVYKL